MKQFPLLWLYGVLSLSVPAFAQNSLPASPAQGMPEAFCRNYPEQHNDFAWENDLVAFRVHGTGPAAGDGGIECWPKRIAGRVIDRWIAAEIQGNPARQDQGEGYPFFQVGNSRGCGGTALWEDGRLRTAGPYRTWSIVSPAKNQCQFELIYEYPTATPGLPIRETKRITLEVGKRFFRSESTFTQNGQPLANLPVAIGVTTHDDKANGTLSPEHRWISCWENINGEFLGTGAILAPNQPMELRALHSPQPDQSHLVILTRTNSEGKVVCYAGFAWKKACAIGSEKDWAAALDEFSKGL